MKEEYIKKFGTKLLASSKSVNKIPTEYMQEAFNARIYDGGIGSRKGKELLLSSTLGTNNKGGFMMGGNLYQVANSKIYLINKSTGEQTEKASLPYNQMVDVLVYKDFAIIGSNNQSLQVFDGESVTVVTTAPNTNTGVIEYTRGFSFLVGGSGEKLNIDQEIQTDDFIFGVQLSSFKGALEKNEGEYFKESFTLLEGVAKIDLTLRLGLEVFAQTDDIEVSIHKTSDDTQVGATQSVNGSSLTQNLYNDCLFSFVSTYDLTTDQAYYFKVQRTGALSVSNGGYRIQGSTMDVYTGGEHQNYKQDYQTFLDKTETSSINSGDIHKQTVTLTESITNPIVRVFLDRTNENAQAKVRLRQTSNNTILGEQTYTIPVYGGWVSLAITSTLSLLTSEAYYIEVTNVVDYPLIGRTTELYGTYSINGSSLPSRSMAFAILEENKTFNPYGDVYFKLEGSYITATTIGSLNISRPITPANPEYAYDFTGTGSQQIVYDETILGLEGTMNGIYIFCTNKVEFLGANSLQNVSGSATFISTPLGKGGEPVNNHCIASSGDKIFYITKNLQLQTVNYIAGTDSPSIGTLSSRAIVGIKEFMKDIDPLQPNAYAFYNKNDETMHFHLRTLGSSYNDVCLVYDLTNDTFIIDTNKNYNYVVQNGYTYYGFSDIDTSIYKDETQDTDNGTAVPFSIKTQAMNFGNLREKMFGGMLIAGGIGTDTTLTCTASVDGEESISEDIVGNEDFEYNLEPFERIGDESQMYELGIRASIEITSNSDKKDFIIDTLGVRLEHTGNMDLTNKL